MAFAGPQRTTSSTSTSTSTSTTSSSTSSTESSTTTTSSTTSSSDTTSSTTSYSDTTSSTTSSSATTSFATSYLSTTSSGTITTYPSESPIPDSSGQDIVGTLTLVTSLSSSAQDTGNITLAVTYTQRVSPSTTSATPSATSDTLLQTQTASLTATDMGSSGSSSISDKTLGIIIGVGLGAVAMIVMIALMWYLWRRRVLHKNWEPVDRASSPTNDHSDGSDLKGGLSTDPEGALIPTREPKLPDVAYREVPAPRKSNSMPKRVPVPMRSANGNGYRPLNEQSEKLNLIPASRPGISPQPSSAPYSADTVGMVSLKDQRRSQSRSRSRSRSSQRISQSDNRPPTPFSPFEFGKLNTHERTVPSADEEATDLVSPIVPTKSPFRRQSGMTHYPSWNEVRDFRFDEVSGGHQPDSNRRESNNRGVSWMSHDDSVAGRYELS